MTMPEAGLPRGDWSYPTAIRFGAGRLSELPDACREASIARPLLVSDPGLVEAGLVARAEHAITAGDMAAGLFADIRGNPTGANVEAGIRAFHDGGHDGLVALGGGSAIDVAKTIALMSGQTRPVWDFEDREDWWRRADASAIRPLIAIPTTAGTGSEVGRAAVINDETTGHKKLIFHPLLLPRVAILDPELAVGLPPALTAATGMDALVHNLEAYVARGHHPIAEGITLEGLRLIAENLERACQDGADLQARGAMLVGSAMGAIAFQKGLGGVHALAHPIGSLFDTHHGLTNAVLLPYVLAFNMPVVGDKLARLARYLDLDDHTPQAVMRWALELRRTVSIPHDLGALGVTEVDITRLVPLAANDQAAAGNPRSLSNQDIAALYSDAIDGRLADT